MLNPINKPALQAASTALGACLGVCVIILLDTFLRKIASLAMQIFNQTTESNKQIENAYVIKIGERK